MTFARELRGPGGEPTRTGAAWKLQLHGVARSSCAGSSENVLADLPEKSESVVFAQLEGEQAKLYKASQDRLALQIAHELPDDLKQQQAAGAGRAHQAAAALLRSRASTSRATPAAAPSSRPAWSWWGTPWMAATGCLCSRSSRQHARADLGERLRAAGKMGHLVLTGSTRKGGAGAAGGAVPGRRGAGVPDLAQGRRRWA